MLTWDPTPLQAHPSQIAAGDNKDRSSHHDDSPPPLDSSKLAMQKRLPEKGITPGREKRRKTNSRVEIGRQHLVKLYMEMPVGDDHPSNNKFEVDMCAASQLPRQVLATSAMLPLELVLSAWGQRGWTNDIISMSSPVIRGGLGQAESVFIDGLDAYVGGVLTNGRPTEFLLAKGITPINYEFAPGRESTISEHRSTVTVDFDVLVRAIRGLQFKWVTPGIQPCLLSYEMTDSCHGYSRPQQKPWYSLNAVQWTPETAFKPSVPPIAATKSDAGIVLSMPRFVGPEMTRQSATKMYEDIRRDLQRTVDPKRLNAMLGNLGKLLKEYADQLGLDELHGRGLFLVHALDEHHNEIGSLFKAKMMKEDETATGSQQSKSQDMSLVEKMEMWDEVDRHGAEHLRKVLDDVVHNQNILDGYDETGQLLESKHNETGGGQDSTPNEKFIVADTPIIEAVDHSSPATQSIQSDSVDTDLLSVSSFSCDVEDDAAQPDKFITSIVESVAVQLFSRIACRQVDTFENAPCDQEPTSNAQNTTGSSAQTQQSKPANIALRLRKRTTADRDEGEDGEDSPQDRRPKKRATSVIASVKQPTFACPFWKHDPIKHFKCVVARLLNSSRVKQHLSRSHKPRLYCQVCFAIFSDKQKQEHEQHVLQQSCTREPGMQLDGITPDQDLQLSKKSKQNLSEEERWYRIWEIVLPHCPKPETPYLDSQLSDSCARLREDLRNVGPEMISRAIESSGVLGRVDTDEATRNRMLRMVLKEVFDMLLDSRTPSSTSQQSGRMQLSDTSANTQEHGSTCPVSSTTPASSNVELIPDVYGTLQVTTPDGAQHQMDPTMPESSTTEPVTTVVDTCTSEETDWLLFLGGASQNMSDSAPSATFGSFEEFQEDLEQV